MRDSVMGLLKGEGLFNFGKMPTYFGNE